MKEIRIGLVTKGLHSYFFRERRGKASDSRKL